LKEKRMRRKISVSLSTAMIFLAGFAALSLAAENREPTWEEFMQQVNKHNQSGRFQGGERRAMPPAAKGVEEFQRALSLHGKKNATPAELKEAAALYQSASDAGIPQASANLALLYLGGRGVKKDPRKAVALLNIASKKEIPQADMLLARLYLMGKDVKRDDKKGEWHLEKAARTGNPEAVRMLGEYRKWKEQNQLAMKQYQEILKKAQANAAKPGNVQQIPPTSVMQPPGAQLFPAIPGQSYLDLSRAAVPPQRPIPPQAGP
jgi:hypothetical protein